MSWLDQLQQASFRGVAFHVDTIDVSAGDNVVVREYPFQDLPTVFRMGDGVEEIKFSAYVIGDDYHEQRERLREVLSGEGVLVHPTAGSIRAYVAGKYRIQETPTAEGGIARFELTFIRAEARRYPVGVANTPAEAGLAADAAALAAQDQFGGAFDMDSVYGWSADQAVARVRASVDAVWDQMKAVSGGLGDFTSAALRNYETLRDGLLDLVSTPRELADQIATLFELPGELTQAARANFMGAFSFLFDMSDRISQADFEFTATPADGLGLVVYGTGTAGPLGEDSPVRATLAQLTSSSDLLFETLATAAWVRAAAQYELTGYDDAMAMRQAIHAQCTRLLTEASALAAPATAPGESWHDAVMALHTTALADLQARSRDLVRLTTYTPEAWQPIWYVSYRLFGTAAYADEILALNPHIEHPLLVPPGRPLRVVRREPA
ncbi:MAG: DNA circularization N-terminal domain-containing protein [Comamonas sp.]